MVSVISSTWRLVGGPGGPKAAKRGEEIRKTGRRKEEEEMGREEERKCKLRDGKMVERVARWFKHLQLPQRSQ